MAYMAKYNPDHAEFTYVFGGGFDESVIKLSISHVDIDPAEITAALHLRPTRAYRKGDLSENKKRIMNHGMWQLATPWVSALEFEENLARFMKKLPSDRRLWRRFASRYDCEITAVLRMRTFNRGAGISPELLREIADRGLKFGLDVYYDDDEALWSKKKVSRCSR